MNKIEALRKEADLREMCEGTTVQWCECIKLSSGVIYKQIYPLEDYKVDELSFALAIVENKPVFVGDELYAKTQDPLNKITVGVNFNQSIAHLYSWSQPKPKTVLVELLVEDAKWYVANTVINHSLAEACRKALKQLNGGGK